MPVCRENRLFHPLILFLNQSYLDLGPHVPLGASGNEKSRSLTVTGDPASSMPADTHLFQIFVDSSSADFWHPVHCCMCESFSLQSEDMSSHFPSPYCNNVLESLLAPFV